jgi:hypothetical protein
MTWSVLKSLYGSVDKIDAYVGALGEDHFDIDEPIGPLFKASVEEQYLRLREGDRFYYENIEVTKFNETELGVIQRTRLADIITRNTKVGKIQCSTMFVPRGSLPYGCGPNKDVPSTYSFHNETLHLIWRCFRIVLTFCFARRSRFEWKTGGYGRVYDI